ncbi:MAG: Hpt domain [Proteobacteria bacterium]|nr:Hpt domain [Pseudomonadota bacterium]
MDSHSNNRFNRHRLFPTSKNMPQEYFVPALSTQPSAHAPDQNLYNAATALSMLDGDMGLLQELALLFLAETPARMKQLRQGIATQDSERIHHNAHAIKGSLGAIGALQVMLSAQALEKAARAANWQLLLPLTQRFESEYNQLCTQLHQTFSE